MFGFHRHRWRDVTSEYVTEYGHFGSPIKRWITYVRCCKDCGKIKSTKICL